jgi:hypothetical protein
MECSCEILSFAIIWVAEVCFMLLHFNSFHDEIDQSIIGAQRYCMGFSAGFEKMLKIHKDWKITENSSTIL